MLPDNEITRKLMAYIADYKANVFDIPRLPPEKVKQFKSDFRIVAEYFANSYQNPDYEPDSAVITHVDEFLKLMKVLTGDNRYEALAFTEQEKKEGIRMCKVLDFRENRGMQRGLQRGAAQLFDLLRILSDQGYSMEQILAMTQKEEDREKLYKQYEII